MSSEKCGTYAGWNAHQYAGENPCVPCREAARLYVREWRARGSEAVVRQQMMHRARSRAVWRLKDLHRADFDLLVADELRVEQMLARREDAS